MSFISIITPVYNIRKYLPTCVSSICDQSFRDWELILVDNGSSDGSGELCDVFAAGDSRISVIHLRENLGPGPARNAGLAVARGTYIHFVDGDDCLAREQMSRLVEGITKHDCPEIAYVPCAVTADPLEPGGAQSPCKPPVDSALAGPMELFIDRHVLGDRTGFQVWMLLFRRDFLVEHALTFKPFRMGEDIDFTARAFCLARDFCVHDAIYYFWRQGLSRSFIATYAHHGWAFLQAAQSMLEFQAGKSLGARQRLLLEQYVQSYLEHFERRFIAGLSKEEILDHLPLVESLARLLPEMKSQAWPHGLAWYLEREGARAGILALHDFAHARDLALLEGFDDRDIYLFPASVKTAWLAWVYKNNGIAIKGFMDNDSNKIGLLMDGYGIYSPLVVSKCYEYPDRLFVVISTSRRSTGRAIAAQMTALGLEEERHFTCMGHDIE